MDKPEICAELDKRGIAYNKNLGVVKLRAILDAELAKEGDTGTTGATGATGATGENAGPTGPTGPEEGASKPAPEGAVEKVQVLDNHGMVCRVYSLAEHGEDFVQLAQDFAAKKGLRIR